MADGTSTFGTDTARYQSIGSYDPGAFEIVNFEDPQRDAKLTKNHADGRRSGVYLWVYPGHDLNLDTLHMVDVMRGVLGRDPELGYWADYEDAGVAPDQLHAFFTGAAARGAYAGYYSGPSALDHGPFLVHDWWNAAYPNNNDGSFPGYGALWASSRPRYMHLWQYSSGGGLDRDVVVDDAWYAALGGPTSEDDMAQADIDKINGALFGDVGFGGTNKGLVQQMNELTSLMEGNPLFNQKPLADVIAAKVTTPTIDVEKLAAAIASKLPAGTAIDPAVLAAGVAAHLHLVAQ